MKNIFKLIPCLAMALVFASCYDTMDDKSSIDAQYADNNAPTVTMVSATAETYSNGVASATVSDVSNVIEEGIMISTDANFSEYTAYPAADVNSSFEVAVSGLSELTTYYVRAYAVTKTAGTVVSNAVQMTTPKMPIYSLEGTYTVTEYELDDNDNWAAEADTYQMAVYFVEGSTTEVAIVNLWNFGGTIYGVWDEESQTIYVPTGQVIGNHSTYGDIYAYGVNSSISAYTNYITFTFNKLGGLMVSSPWAARVQAGLFGFYYVSMKHDD